MTLAADPTPRLMTTEELLAMPDDGIERWLIRGQLREGGVTRRNWRHSRHNVDFAYVLARWLREHPDVGGQVVGGEAGFQLTDDPDSTCGIDVAYVSKSLSDATPENASLIKGPPVLAVEILSPSDKMEAIEEKIEAYLAAGVRLVWIVEPVFKTITVYRPDAEPELFSLSDEITAEPHLPGFKAAVAELFGLAPR
jgi:Uma2 family endonuclease